MATQQYSSGLVIQKIVIHKFMSYCGKDPQTLVLRGSLISVNGKTGSGKSTCIEALLYAFFNKTLRSHIIGINKIVEKGGFVEITFEMSHNLYIIKRGINLKNDKFLSITENGVEIHGLPTELTQKVMNIIGMNEETFLTTTVLPQDEPTIADFKPKQRTEILKNIFRLDALTNAHNIIKEKVSLLEGKISTLTREKEIYQKQYQDASTLETQKKAFDDKLIVSTDQLQEYTKKVTAIESEYRILLKKRDVYLQAQQTAEQQKQLISRELITKQNLKAPNMSIVPALKEKVQTLPHLQDELKKIREIARNVSDINREIKINQAMIASVNKDCETNLHKYDALSASYPESPEEVFERALKGKATLEDLKNAFKPVIFEEFKKEFIIERDNKIKEIRAKIMELTESLPESEGLKTEDECASQIQEIQQIANKISQLEIMEKNYGENLHRIESNILDAQEKEKVAYKRMESVRSDYNNVDAMEKAFTIAQNKKHETDLEMQQIRSNIAMLETAIKTNNAIERKLKDIDSQLGENATIFSALSELKKPIFDDFQVFSLDYYLNQLSIEASRLIMRMTAHRLPEIDEKGRPRKYTEITFENKKGGIEIRVNGYEIKSFSGGEQTLISMAIRIAISIMLSKMGSASRTLFIDEGKIGSLDQDAREVYMNMLLEVRKYFDKIILITHIDGLTQKFNQFVEINMHKGHSEIKSIG